MTPSLSSITVYPVKSTAGIALDEAVVESRGLAMDRRWMLVDERGDCVTAREHSRLVLVRAETAGSALVLHAPGMAALRIADARGDGDMVDVAIWRSALRARHVDARADAWFRDYLGVPCRLIYMGDDERRAVNPEHAQPGDEVSFADGYPLLLVADASLEDLNARAVAAASMRRFRPNLTVSGCAPFAEDGWRRLRIGAVEFEGPKLCDRCVMTTIDPDTGERDAAQEPLRTLSRYRRDDARGILFGLNLIPRSAGVVRVGDRLQVLA